MANEEIRRRFPCTCHHVSKMFLDLGGTQQGADFMLAGMTVLRHPSFMRNIEHQLESEVHGDEVHQLHELINDVFNVHKGITL